MKEMPVAIEPPPFIEQSTPEQMNSAEFKSFG
jgi:hypothetical protein